VVFALLTIVGASGSEFQISKDGVGPIMMETNVEVAGKSATFTGTARNDSGVAIQRAEWCVQARGQTACAFKLWSTSVWQPGETLKWEITGKAVNGLPAHEVSLTTLKRVPPAAAGPTKEIPLIPIEPVQKPNRLLPIQSIFVDQLDGNNAPMIREQVMALLANSDRFRAVDDPKTADATIKGRAETRDSATAVTASGKTVVGGVSMLAGGSNKSQSMTEVIVSEAIVLRLTLPSGETIWAWDDTKPCKERKAKCAIEDLVAAAQGARPAAEQKSGSSGKKQR